MPSGQSYGRPQQHPYSFVLPSGDVSKAFDAIGRRSVGSSLRLAATSTSVAPAWYAIRHRLSIRTHPTHDAVIGPSDLLSRQVRNFKLCDNVFLHAPAPSENAQNNTCYLLFVILFF